MYTLFLKKPDYNCSNYILFVWNFFMNFNWDMDIT